MSLSQQGWQSIPYLTVAENQNLANRPSRPVPAHLWQAAEYHPNQWAYLHVHTSNARFNAFATSRQCGKTTAIQHDILDALFEAPRDNDQTHQRDPLTGKITRANPNVVGVMSDTYEHAELVVQPFISLLTAIFGESFYSLNKNQHVLRINLTGAELRWFSAENPRAAQGHTFSRVYIDEAQNVSDAFWVNLRPALGARLAQVFAFGTPDPVEESSWFEGLFLRGQDPDELNYYSYSVPCTLNRWLPLEDVQDALYTMSEREFRMKYLGQWVKHDGAVFRDSEACFTGSWKHDSKWEPDKQAYYIMGLDLAKNEDYTVAYMFDVRKRTIVERWRINHLDYVQVSDRVADLYHKYGCKRIRMDNTGVGEPVYDMLRAKGLHITPYTFGQKSKEKLVSTLAREIEHKRLVLPKEDTQLLRELRAFTRKVTPAGNIQYTAPVNFHDDCIMALGLAVLEAANVGVARVGSYLD
jgi:hypothetical protein